MRRMGVTLIHGCLDVRQRPALQLGVAHLRDEPRRPLAVFPDEVQPRPGLVVVENPPEPVGVPWVARTVGHRDQLGAQPLVA